MEEGTDIGPLIDAAALERVERLIQSGIDEGAECLLDGRGVKVPKYANGNFCGPTLLHNVKPGMKCYDEEIFGPVCACVWRVGPCGRACASVVTVCAAPVCLRC